MQRPSPPTVHYRFVVLIAIQAKQQPEVRPTHSNSASALYSALSSGCIAASGGEVLFSSLCSLNTSACTCRSLAAKYNMPMELAYSMASLALYDIIIYADDSGSMAFEEGGERISDLKLMVGRVADVATLFDDDGILVRFMNGMTEGNGIRDSASAGQLISQASAIQSPHHLNELFV